MKLLFTKPFLRDYHKLSKRFQGQTDKVLAIFCQNPYHPSLKVKKMAGIAIWEARVTKGYRFTFEIERDTYFLRRVGTHDILRNP